MTNQSGPVHPRARKRTWLLLTVGGVILVAMVWSAIGGPGWERGPRPEPILIPDPNGYDDVLEAGRAIEQSRLTGAKFDLAKADQAELEVVVRGCGEAIARGRKGLEKAFQVPVIYDMNQLGVLMKELTSIRGGLVRAMLAEGRLAELQGRVDEATDRYVDVIRLGDAMSHRVFMFAYQVSVAAQSTGLHHLRDLRAKLSPESCRRVIALLEETDRNRERAADVMLRETRFMNGNLKKMGFFAGFMMRVSGVQAKTVAQVTTSLESSEARQNVARRLLLTDLALRVYRQAHGEDPPDLDALVPSILTSVPLDPFSDKPLRYQKRGKDGVVYSVGPDRDDDRLARTLIQRHSPTADGDFTIDSF